MIKLNVLELLEKRGRTRYWLNKQLGMSFQNFTKMVENKTKSISYKNIELLCDLLECTPDDLFTIDTLKH
jgi:Predicted transcriptional regulator